MSYNDLIGDEPPLAQEEVSEEDEPSEVFEYWIEDLESVKWYFLKTRKSKKAPTPGVLITNEENYKYQYSAANKNKTRHTFTCSEKPRTGCNAVARLIRHDIVGAEGEPDAVKWELDQLSSEMVHGLFHPPVRATIIADRIMNKMTSLMREDPLQDAVRLRDRVLAEDLQTLPEDDQRQVEKVLPLRPEGTLNKIKNDMLGVIPKTRDQFDPKSILKMAHSIGGDKILILDSNCQDDLPPDWRNIDMKSLFDDPASDSLAASIHSSTGSGVGVDIAASDLELDDDVFTAPAARASQNMSAARDTLTSRDTSASSTGSASTTSACPRVLTAPASRASEDISASRDTLASRDTSASSSASVGHLRRPASTPASTQASSPALTPASTDPASRDATASSSSMASLRPSTSVTVPPRPPRVIIVTTIEALSLLAICRYGSVDGTFWIMSKLFAQLFIMLARLDKHHLPVSFAYLPDKTFTSYYVFLFMLLRAFRKRRSEILKIVPQANLMMRVVKMDYEIAIHKAFRLFKRKGCFFHYGQCIWRYVAGNGMTKAYHYDTELRNLVRMVCGLVFVPPEMLPEAIRQLRAYKFNPESKFYEQNLKFQDILLDTHDRVWMNGSFPPSMWNHANETTNLTNNDNENYNSQLNKLAASPHQNVVRLLYLLVKESVKAIDLQNKIKTGAKTKKRIDQAVVSVQQQRESLMKNLAHGRIPLMTFLREIGSLSLKIERKRGKVVFEENSAEPPVSDPDIARDDSDTDSLSETIPLNITLYPDEVQETVESYAPFADEASAATGQGRGRGRGQAGGRGGQPAGGRGGRGARGRPRGRPRGRGQGGPRVPSQREKCYCGIGIQPNKDPPNWVRCVQCRKVEHDRCTHNDAAGGDTDWRCAMCEAGMTEPRDTAQAQTCEDTEHTPDSPVLTEAPALVSETQAPTLTPETEAPAIALAPESFSVPVPGVPAEMLLQEPVGDVIPATIPSYIDNLSNFDRKMFTLGMKRSDTQPNTPANGNCGPEAILDGYNRHQLPGKSRFPRNDPLSTQRLRMVVAHEVRKAVDDGLVALVQVGNNIGEWCDEMQRDGKYVDHTFMEMSARILDSDIVVVSLHGNASGPGHVIRAGILDGDPYKTRPGKNMPIFIGYFEEERHTAGHFQALEPFKDSEILDMVKTDGGVDTAEKLKLPLRPQEAAEMSFAPNVNSTQFQTPAPELRNPSDVTITPPPTGTPFCPSPRRPAALPSFSLTLSESPVVPKPAQKRAKKRVRTPSPKGSPIPILRFNRNRENDEWMKLAAATRKSRRIREQRK